MSLEYSILSEAALSSVTRKLIAYAENIRKSSAAGDLSQTPLKENS
jgi:hypothetical protein